MAAMDEIDALFADSLVDGLNTDATSALTGAINGDINGDLNGTLEGQLENDLNEALDVQMAEPLNGHLDILQNIPAPPGLDQRLDELHSGGCNQSLAWSRLGALACIGADRKSVSIKCLQFQHDANWHLSQYTDPMLMEKLSVFYKSYDFVHVAWSPLGTELIVIDACGRIAVGMVWIALNRIVVQKVLNNDSEDNMNAVVAIKWMVQVRKPIVHAGTATRENGHWRYPLSTSEARGPFSPNQRPGFIVLTRGGVLKVFLQSTAPGEWIETKHELEGFSSSHDIITHATMCVDRYGVKKAEEDVLIAVHTTSRKLRLYNVRLNWQVSSDSSVVTGSMIAQHVAQLNLCFPSLELDMMNGVMGLAQDDQELCFLNLVPGILPVTGQVESSPPIVMATFSQTGLAGSMNTTILRWELANCSTSIDASFESLSTKKSTSAHMPVYRCLKQLEEVRFDRIAINVELVHQDTMIALCFSTGEVYFRDRNMIPLQLEENQNQTKSLGQLGFSFDISEPCLQTALAPHSTVKVTMNKEHECRLSCMHLLLSLADSDTLSQVGACFVLQHAASEVIGSNPNDDLIMTMWEFEQQLTEDEKLLMEAHFMKDIYKTHQITDKCSDTNIDSLIRFNGFARTVSLQSSVGVRTADEGKLTWTRPGKIAFVVQSLRIIALSLSFSVNALQKGQEIELHRPETVDHITPLVKWFITLMDYILDQLFDINRVMGVDEAFDGNLVLVKAPSGYACLVLVMCTITRNYLRYIIRIIKTLPGVLQNSMAASPQHALKYTALSSALRSGVITPMQLDEILARTDQVLHIMYPKLQTGQRQEIEMQLLAGGNIPIALSPMIQKLLGSFVEQSRLHAGDLEEVLYFKQWGPVSLVDDTQTLKWVAETTWDGSRKVDISGRKVRIRTCLRCTGLMEDIMPSKDRAQRSWLTNLTKTCFCGGHWIVDRPPETT